MAPRLQSAGPLTGFTYFEPLQQTHLLPSQCPLQPVEERGAPSTPLIPPAAVHLSPSGPRFPPLAVKKVQGTSSGVGIHAVQAGEMGAAFRVPKCGNRETLDVTLLQLTPLATLSVRVCNPF